LAIDITMQKEIKHFINGEFVGSKSGKIFDNFNPATNAKLGIVHEAGKEEVDQAVKAANAALKGPWGKLPMAERMALLHKVADGINARFDEFLEVSWVVFSQNFLLVIFSHVFQLIL